LDQLAEIRGLAPRQWQGSRVEPSQREDDRMLARLVKSPGVVCGGYRVIFGLVRR